MKTREGFVLKKVADSFVIVPTGKNTVDFTAMITINETGAFIWDLLKSDVDIDFVAGKMCDEYGIDIDTAKADALEFIAILEQNNVLESWNV